MRHPGIALLVAASVTPFAAGCAPACASGERGEPGTYTLNLSDVTPGDPDIPLTLSNDTLVFPLATEQETQFATEDAPGDLVIAYTRLGCWIDDPGEVVGDIDLRDVPPVRLKEVTFDQSPDSAGACFTYRTCDGVWHPLLSPTSSTTDGDPATATLTLNADAVDAVAIFLPLYTHASRITYTTE